MSSDNRNISGAVDVRQENEVAACAMQLANALWVNEYQRAPKLSDVKFLDLVELCVGALKGKRRTSNKYSEAVKQLL